MIQPRNDTMTWLAGLYRMKDGLPYFTVLTREAVEDIRFIYNRMPLMFLKDMIRDWISPDSKPATILSYALTDMVAEKV